MCVCASVNSLSIYSLRFWFLVCLCVEWVLVCVIVYAFIPRCVRWVSLHSILSMHMRINFCFLQQMNIQNYLVAVIIHCACVWVSYNKTYVHTKYLMYGSISTDEHLWCFSHNFNFNQIVKLVGKICGTVQRWWWQR